MSRATALLFIVMAVLATAAAAEDFSTTNVQLLGASRLKDPGYGYDVRGGLQTLTIEHFRSSKTGDLYAFIDFLHGDQAGPNGASSGEQTRFYGEICARLNVGTMTGRPLAFGPVTNTYLAVEVDDGRHYTGWLTGVGVDLHVPGLDSATVNLFRKDDSFNRPALQTTVIWSRNIRLRSTSLTFAGYLDAVHTDHDGMDIGTEPQLLVDLSPLLHVPHGRFEAGVEWYVHRNANFSVRAPQLLFKWTLK
jgi:nucleoside-specific outer membrane channel protein Tsx